MCKGTCSQVFKNAILFIMQILNIVIYIFALFKQLFPFLFPLIHKQITFAEQLLNIVFYTNF